MNSDRAVSLTSLFGLSALYASAYYFPPLGLTGAYLLPSSDLLRLIVLPTLVFAIVVTITAYATAILSCRWLSPRFLTAMNVVLLSIMTLIGMKGIFYAAGTDWRDHVPWGTNLVLKLRYSKAVVWSIVVVSVWSTRHSLGRWTRFLSSLGYAFCLLAATRLLFLLVNMHTASPDIATISNVGAPSDASSPVVSGPRTPDGRPRRVVWVIFDELDFGRLFDHRPTGESFPNFDRLAGMSVFAQNANSPASATIYSIPSLLTGVPMNRDGIKIDRSASLLIERPDRTPIRLQDDTTIFGAVAASGRTVSVLGFYHPYCKLFRLARCDSMAWPGVGGLTAAIWPNLPDYFSSKVDGEGDWDGITRKSLKLLPQYLAREDALTFVHLNFPHPPSDFADRTLRLRPSQDPLTEYFHNLMLADRVLGSIMEELEHDTTRHELLLIVSTDHWLRNLWYRADVKESQKPIPFMVWKVGERDGQTLFQPLSTIHTRSMILDYLNENITTQSDIAHWWAGKPVFPSYIAK